MIVHSAMILKDGGDFAWLVGLVGCAIGFVAYIDSATTKGILINSIADLARQA